MVPNLPHSVLTESHGVRWYHPILQMRKVRPRAIKVEVSGFKSTYSSLHTCAVSHSLSNHSTVCKLASLCQALSWVLGMHKAGAIRALGELAVSWGADIKQGENVGADRVLQEGLAKRRGGICLAFYTGRNQSNS